MSYFTPDRTDFPPARGFDLFPTRIWQARLGWLAPRFPEWIALVEEMRRAAPEPAGRTIRGGWNSDESAVLERPSFEPLAAAIRVYCAQSFHEMGAGEPAFALQSWVNLHDRGGFNFQHMHEGTLLSGTFYLRVPPGSGALVFRDPRPGVMNASVKGDGANAYKEVRLAPDAGLLVLFPHWLEHYVEPHDADEPRIAIPFNALRP